MEGWGKSARRETSVKGWKNKGVQHRKVHKGDDTDNPSRGLGQEVLATSGHMAARGNGWGCVKLGRRTRGLGTEEIWTGVETEVGQEEEEDV